MVFTSRENHLLHQKKISRRGRVKKNNIFTKKCVLALCNTKTTCHYFFLNSKKQQGVPPLWGAPTLKFPSNSLSH